MKKILFLLPAMLIISTITHASFPVTNEDPALIENCAILPLLEDGTIFNDSNNTSTEVPVSDIDWTLFWVCIFCGTLGVHRYMMGDIRNGILMTLTLGGLYVWWIMDLIKISKGELSR
jgi:hypothetical protein